LTLLQSSTPSGP